VTTGVKDKLTSRIQLFAGILLLALCALIVDSMREKVVEAGDRAPGFSVVTDAGKKITRSEFGGKLLVLNFWATWCPPCIEEMPSLIALNEKFAGQGLVVVGVSVDRDEQKYRQFLKRAGVKFETARDPEANISASYGTYKYPETYIIDREGKVVEKVIGARDWMDVKVLQSIQSQL
jgi:cytochrome c biogenesis protein CcmG/thiol:disulfide interchange protein DsbE